MKRMWKRKKKAKEKETNKRERTEQKIKDKDKERGTILLTEKYTNKKCDWGGVTVECRS